MARVTGGPNGRKGRVPFLAGLALKSEQRREGACRRCVCEMPLHAVDQRKFNLEKSSIMEKKYTLTDRHTYIIIELSPPLSRSPWRLPGHLYGVYARPLLRPCRPFTPWPSAISFYLQLNVTYRPIESFFVNK